MAIQNSELVDVISSGVVLNELSNDEKKETIFRQLFKKLDEENNGSKNYDILSSQKFKATGT